MAGFRSKTFKYLLAFTIVVGSLQGQIPAEMGDAALNEKVIELVKQNKFLEARPFLQEMEKRMNENPDEKTLEAIAFFDASSYLEEYQNSKSEEALKTAIQKFEEYVSKYPSGPRKIIALLNLGDAYSDLKQHAKAIQTYASIYNNPKTSGPVRNDIRRVIAQAYLKTDKPESGMSYFLEAYNQAVLNEEARAEAATWLLQAYLSMGEIDSILPYFSDLTGTKAALYNPKFNVTLIKAGDQLFESGNYDFAILFYAIVKKKEDIVAFYGQAVEQLKLALSYREKGSDEAITIEKRLREAEANLKAVRGIREYDADVRWRTARVLQESERTWEALWSYYNLMLDYPKHEQAEEFLFLAFSQANKVNDFVMVVQLAKDYLARPEYTKYRGQITLDLADYYLKNGYPQEFYDLAVDYLNDPEQDKVAFQIANLLAIYLMERELYGELFQRMDRYHRANPDFPGLQECTKYWSSLALIIAADYERSLVGFNEFLQKYGAGSTFSEDAYYRRAISLYGVSQPDEAYEKFTTFVNSYPESTRRGEAELYLGDIKREKDQLKNALGHYVLVEQYTDRLAFITKATFAISEVQEVNRKAEEASQTLLTYIDRYKEQAQLGEAYLRLGELEQRRDNIAKRFEYHSKGLQATANDPTRYAADQILIEYVEDYPEFVKNYEAAISLINEMLDDDDFRDKMLNDRAAQYQYFQTEEGMAVDPTLIQQIVRDRAFRRDLLEKPDEILNVLREEYTQKLAALQPYEPERIFAQLLADTPEPKTVLQLRVLMGREILTGNETIFPFANEQVKDASPAVMLWRAKKLRTLNPAAANALLEVSLEKHPYEPNRYETMFELSEIAMDKAKAEPTKENWEEALAKYNSVIERFGMRADDGAPFLAKAEVLIQLGREEEATATLSDILRNPEWRGEPQARAHLQLGIAYYNQASYAEAHGFFERLMLGFGGFLDQVAMAYYWDIKTLEAMNADQDVKKLLAEVRTREDLKETEGYRLIEENYAL